VSGLVLTNSEGVRDLCRATTLGMCPPLRRLNSGLTTFPCRIPYVSHIARIPYRSGARSDWGVGVGGESVAVGLGVGVSVGFGLGAAVGVKVEVGVGTGIGTGVGVGSGVGTGEGAGVGVGTRAVIGVGEGAGVGVGAGTGIGVGEGAGIGVGEGAGVGVGAGEAMLVGKTVIPGTEVPAGTGRSAIISMLPLVTNTTANTTAVTQIRRAIEARTKNGKRRCVNWRAI